MFTGDYTDIQNIDSDIKRYSSKFNVDPSTIEFIIQYNIEYTVKNEYEGLGMKDKKYEYNKQMNNFSVLVVLYDDSQWICSYYEYEGQPHYITHRYIRDKSSIQELHNNIVINGLDALSDYVDDSLLAEFVYEDEYSFIEYKTYFSDTGKKLNI